MLDPAMVQPSALRAKEYATPAINRRVEVAVGVVRCVVVQC